MRNRKVPVAGSGPSRVTITGPANQLPVGKGPFRKGLLTRYETNDSLRKRDGSRKRRRGAKNKKDDNGVNDNCFFMPPLAPVAMRADVPEDIAALFPESMSQPALHDALC